MTNTRSKQDKQVTQAEVAERAGVSRAIVSYVINNGPRNVAKATRQRVLEAIEELDYRPNQHAQRLIQEQAAATGTKQIGVIVSASTLFTRPYYGTILAGIHDEASERQYQIRFIRLFESLKDPILRNQLIHKSEISGLVLLALDQVLQTDEEKALLRRILERVDNAVCLEWHYEGLPTVGFDRHNAAYGATTHLLGLGCSSLAYVGPNDQRARGFQAALSEAGIQTPLPATEANDARTGFAAGVRLQENVQGIVAGTDEVAFGLLRSLHEQGKHVPKDVRLVSIDNIDLSEFSSPSLTTVDVPKRALGRQAVRLLIERTRSLDATPVLVTLPTSLVVRESCGSSMIR